MPPFFQAKLYDNDIASFKISMLLIYLTMTLTGFRDLSQNFFMSKVLQGLQSRQHRRQRGPSCRACRASNSTLSCSLRLPFNSITRTDFLFYYDRIQGLQSPVKHQHRRRAFHTALLSHRISQVVRSGQVIQSHVSCIDHRYVIEFFTSNW